MSWWQGGSEPQNSNKAPTDLGSSSFSIVSFCLFILFMGFSRQEYWSGLPFPSPVDHILSDLSTMARPSRVALQAWLSFIELDKAVVLVWLNWLVFCEYDFSVSTLWYPLSTPTTLLGFLLPWAWGISSRLLQQSAAAAPYLGWGVCPHRHPSWPSMWDSFSRPSCAHAATGPWTWGWIRLIIFLAAKDGEALYSQQKQDWELTVAQIMKQIHT